MSEEGTAPPSIPESNQAARAQLVTRLQSLWQSDPGSYWKEFRASGLEPTDVWPDAVDYSTSDTFEKEPGRKPGRK